MRLDLTEPSPYEQRLLITVCEDELYTGICIIGPPRSPYPSHYTSPSLVVESRLRTFTATLPITSVTHSKSMGPVGGVAPIELMHDCK